MKAFTQLSQKRVHVQAYVQKKQETHLPFMTLCHKNTAAISYLTGVKKPLSITC